MFHLAGLADIVPSITNPKEYFKSNVLGTFNILEASKNFKIKRFIFNNGSLNIYPDIYWNIKFEF